MSAYRGLIGGQLRLVLRATLALSMIASGIFRLIPVAMPPLRPLDQLQRLGELTQGELLRTLVGASPVFQSFTGAAALLGGVLLLFPRTTLLGALISAANLAMAVTLALCYDLPSKLYVSCLFVLSLLLLAPDLRRLADLFLLDRRSMALLLFVFGLYLIHSGFKMAAERYERLNPPRPALYGVWTVEDFTRDGKDVPLYSEPDRWQLVVFQTPGSLRIGQMAGAWKTYTLGLDMERKTMTLGPSASAFTLQRPEKDVLILDGQMEGRRIRAKLRKMPLIRRTT